MSKTEFNLQSSAVHPVQGAEQPADLPWSPRGKRSIQNHQSHITKEHSSWDRGLGPERPPLYAERPCPPREREGKDRILQTVAAACPEVRGMLTARAQARRVAPELPKRSHHLNLLKSSNSVGPGWPENQHSQKSPGDTGAADAGPTPGEALLQKSQCGRKQAQPWTGPHTMPESWEGSQWGPASPRMPFGNTTLVGMRKWGGVSRRGKAQDPRQGSRGGGSAEGEEERR